MLLAARFVIAALVCALLFWGQAVLMPLALASLIAFMLHPLVIRLQRIRVPRMIAVAAAMLLGTGVIAGACWMIASQLTGFTNELPAYQRNISAKIGQVQEAMRGGAMEKVQHMFAKVAQEARDREAKNAPTSTQEDMDQKPTPVVVQSPKEWIDLSLLNSALPLLEPLVTGGLIFVLVALMLLRWEDLRSRLVSVLNQNLTRTTRAIDDAGKRIARYLAMQFLINSSFGLAVGIGLWALGVPYAALWGLCAAMFRYVPYAGPLAAAVLPLFVSLVTSTGWGQVAGVAALFLTLEMLSNNFMEPWLYGWRLGLSELGVIIAAVAWTFLWGTAGLVLATPLTVCLVVLGEHVPALAFFSRLLGDKSALPMHLRFYQRLLAGDRMEAADLAHQHARKEGFTSTSDFVIAPALAHARDEEVRGSLSEAEVSFISNAIPFVIDRADEDDEKAVPATATNEIVPGLVVAWPLCTLSEVLVPLLQHHCEDLPCRWRVLPENSLSSEAITTLATVDEMPVAVCLLMLHLDDLSRARSLCKKLRKLWPNLHITVACWSEIKGTEAMEKELHEAGAAKVAWTPSSTRAALAPFILDQAQHAPATPLEKVVAEKKQEVAKQELAGAEAVIASPAPA